MKCSFCEAEIEQPATLKKEYKLRFDGLCTFEFVYNGERFGLPITLCQNCLEIVMYEWAKEIWEFNFVDDSIIGKLNEMKHKLLEKETSLDKFINTLKQDRDSEHGNRE